MIDSIMNNPSVCYGFKESEKSTMQNPKGNEVICRRASLNEIIPLRDAVLIQGTNRVSPYFDGDRDSTTLHFGAFQGERTLVCLTFLRNTWEEKPAWQLRGMATDPEFQKMGLGARLLTYAESVLHDLSDVNHLWCNARMGAVDFYRKQGWIVASEEFLIPGVGQHIKMTKSLIKMYHRESPS